MRENGDASFVFRGIFPVGGARQWNDAARTRLVTLAVAPQRIL
jgi:hypothetical protein